MILTQTQWDQKLQALFKLHGDIPASTLQRSHEEWYGSRPPRITAHRKIREYDISIDESRWTVTTRGFVPYVGETLSKVFASMTNLTDEDILTILTMKYPTLTTKTFDFDLFKKELAWRGFVGMESEVIIHAYKDSCR